jgi:endonuclease-3
MTSNNEHILVTLARQQFMNTERETVHLVNEPEINAFLNDIEQYPYAYVLACLMDRLIKAEKAWSIPFYIKEAVGSFTINAWASNSLEFGLSLFVEGRPT